MLRSTVEVSPSSLFTQRHPRSRSGRLLQFPLVRIPVAVLFISPAILVQNLVMIYGVERLDSPWSGLVRNLVLAGFVCLVFLLYGLYVRSIEGRSAHELSMRGAGREILAGVGLAALLVGSSAGAMLTAGSYHVVGVDRPWILADALFVFASGAFVQVMLFRLILFRLTEEFFGTWMALVFVGLLFGLSHAARENMTAVGFLGFVLEAVILLAAFAMTRRLWLAWGLHAGWNYLQDGILGLPNSGVTSLPSFLQAETTGPTWLTGGGFGIEASAFTVGLTLLCSLWMIREMVQGGKIVSPSWRRGS